jgi:hypothetical protein
MSLIGTAVSYTSKAEIEMKLLVPKIKLQTLRKEQSALYQNLSATNYGETLAADITEKLLKSEDTFKGLYHAHRDYCGIGLFYENGTFTLSIVDDGYAPGEPIAIFDSQTDFTAWLSQESDQSMSLYGQNFNNQTITKVRLDWYLEENYSPVWNAFCAYIHSL